MSSTSGYPIALIEDRYDGAYNSGGLWIAIAEADEFVDGTNTRAQYILMDHHGPFSGDLSAQKFWTKPPAWIAVGSNPGQAIENLQKRIPGYHEPDAHVIHAIKDSLKEKK